MILTCTIGLLVGVGTWDGISIRRPHIPRPWNPIRAIDECVTRLQEQVHRQARFGLVELPGTKAVKHKPLTEELGGELQNDLSFQTGAIDGKARCDSCL